MGKVGEASAIFSPLRTIGLCLGLFGTIFGVMTSVAAAAAGEPTGDVRMALPSTAAALLPMALSVVTTGAAAFMGDQMGKEIARYCLRLEIFADEFLLIVSCIHTHVDCRDDDNSRENELLLAKVRRMNTMTERFLDERAKLFAEQRKLLAES